MASHGWVWLNQKSILTAGNIEDVILNDIVLYYLLLIAIVLVTRLGLIV